ncbi:MAG: DNA-directed RNA polymerase subunit alpha [Candidatus Nomurabacteria bacterium]|nr:DNA-directed RNA polymerase subunit alpha [Candidatus Nomurabacteria bacterium]
MSNTIYNPIMSEVVDHSATSSTFTIKPLHQGYGNTLGNSLRRVLLSSIHGAAVTSVKIDGASHEFAAIDGVKEDVVDIILNLKKLHFKMVDDEQARITLKQTGGVITGGSFKLPTGVSLANPEQIIATIDDPKKTIVMEITVDAGRGYEPVFETAEKRKSTEQIAIDAIYTPVLRVRYHVADARIGHDMSMQQLEMTIDTDGTISPREAFEEAAAILVNQYTALAGSTKVEGTAAPGTEAAIEAGFLATPVEDLGFSVRTTNALINNNLLTVADLLQLSDADMREIPGFGAKALEEVTNKIKELEK